MSLYPYAVFAHLLGVLSLFIGMGLQWTTTFRLRRAQTVGQVREWAGLVRGTGQLAPVSGVLILGAGIYMMVVAWSLTTPWIMVSLAAMALMMVFGMVITSRQLRAIQRSAMGAGTPTDSISPELQRQTHNPVLWVSTQLAASTALGIVFMMTTKPDLAGSLLTIAAALTVGALVGVATAKARSRSQRVSATERDADVSQTA